MVAETGSGSQSFAAQAIMGRRPLSESVVLNEPVPRNGARLLFARTFLRNPVMLGSVIPSSRFLIKGVLEPIDWERARVIVEYGPGVGTITGEILNRMRADAKLIVIEMNREFVRYLRETFRDERLQVVEGSAADVREVLAKSGFAHAEYIISGIPLGSMQLRVRENIVRQTKAALAPGGAFVVYQFTSRVLPELQRVFEVVNRGREWLNVLPAHLFFCAAAPIRTNGNGSGNGAQPR
jgi:phospholipid N-methyltransferase